MLNEVSVTARTAYRIKKELQAEQQRRFVPDYAEPLDLDDITETEPGGLTSKQISEIRKWAKTRHSTDDLILFITKIVGQQ